MTLQTTPADFTRNTAGADACTPAGLIAAIALTQPLADVLCAAWTRTDDDGIALLPLTHGWTSADSIRAAAQITAGGVIAGISARLTYGLPLGADHAIRTAAEGIAAATDADALTHALDSLLAGIGARFTGTDLDEYARLITPINDAVAYELRGGVRRGIFPTSVADRVLDHRARIVSGSAREIAERLVAPATNTSWTRRDLVLALGGSHPTDLDEAIATSVVAAITNADEGVAAWKDAVKLGRDLRSTARKTARKIAA